MYYTPRTRTNVKYLAQYIKKMQHTAYLYIVVVFVRVHMPALYYRTQKCYV
jgi:hypothetical protein